MSSTLVVAAVLADGVPVPDVALNDGSVWVTNSSQQLVGRLNRQINELGSGFRAANGDFDVLQNASQVLVYDRAGSVVQPVDVAYAALRQKVEVPADATVALGGETVAVLRPDDGALWVRPFAQLGSLNVVDDRPDATLGAGAQVVVGPDGTAHGLSVAQSLVVALGSGGTRATQKLAGPLPSEPGAVDLTAVGAQAVVLDRSGGKLLVPGKDPVRLGVGDGAVLQQPGPAAGRVLVATRDTLLDVPFDGGDAIAVPAGAAGDPAPPVRVGSCVHAAWAGSSRYAKVCQGSAPKVVDVPGGKGSQKLVFRVNRAVVVLNDVLTGNVWLLDDAMTLVSNWASVTPPEDSSEDESDAVKEQVEAAQAERQQENRPPTAADDDLGVRAGRSTLLPVLDNDSDPDGDVLTVQSIEPRQSAVGTAQLVSGGTAVQLDVPADAKPGSAALKYAISDGRGGTASAVATVTVRGADVNGPPAQLRKSSALVEQGRSVTTRVLGDFRDPDGDDLVLTAATPTTDDTVRFRPDGSVTFVDSGTAPGRKTVTLTVSDGKVEATGVLTVDVRPPGALPPVAIADHVVAYVGRPATVAPLTNDTDPNGDPLRLARVDQPAELQVKPDYARGTFTLLPQRAGTFYLTYLVTDGPNSAGGLVRVDVLAPEGQNRAPVAVRDQALLPAGGYVLVDPLVNDEDADGDVLVLQSVTGAAQAGLSVAISEHRVLRISALRALGQAVTLGYTVSDGQSQANGTIVVVPVPRAAQQQPPTAVPDQATVRAGDIVTIPVLANDSHPDGDKLALANQLAEPATAGLLFVAGSVLRFQAPDEPGTVTAVYTITDSQGQSASAQVSIYVRPADPTNNAAPQPEPITARVFAGSTTRITVPLAGIDPDGDSVTLRGLGAAPSKGRILQRGPDWFDYEAFATSSGTDEFSYVVADRFGASAASSIRVGIAPRVGNQPPVAVDDVALVRPGRAASVPVLANDSDPDGDVVRFADPALQVPVGVEARTVGGSVVARAADAGTVTIPYSIEDGRGGQATAYVTVEFRPDAPLLAPIARDDEVTPEQALGKSVVDVPVLVNDEDPDGAVSDLVVAVADRAAPTAQVTGSSVRVQLTPDPQTVAYSITDLDGLKSWAFVTVPGTDQAVPTLRPGASLEVVSGSSLTTKLSDTVLVRAGREPRLTQESRVSATNSDGSPLVVDATTMTFTPAADYAGPASLTFEVTDGSGPDDPEGRLSVLTLPITVIPKANRPPTWTGAQLQVAPGEAPVVLDLRTAVTDPDPADADKLRFSSPQGLPPGLSATLDGSRLQVKAGPEVPKGTVVTLALTVTDGTTAAVPAPVTITVTASTRPLAKAVDDVVQDADQGKPTVVDVLANDSNPFPDQPLALLGAVLETGRGDVSVEGGKVRVTPAGDFVGTLVARYTIADATGDIDRQAEGRVRVTVRGRPDRPAAPTVLEVRDRTVVLTWSAPASNGAPISGYRVDAVGKDYTRDCPGTTCTLDGLTNNVAYQFTVIASNVVGDSDPSGASASARPDVRPDRPAPPTLVFGDKSLAVSWTAPTSAGSAIESYDLEISPAGAGSGSVTVTGTSYTWSGLTNGQSYQVHVRAKNSAPEPSEFSDYSRPEIPAGVPSTPAAPTGEPTGGAIGGQVTVRWTEPTSDNGASIDFYDLQVFKTGSLVQTIRAPGTETTKGVTAENASDYTFRVVAINKAGPSTASAASSAIRPFGEPGQIASVQAAPLDRAATLTFVPPSSNGKAIVRYEYMIVNGATGVLASDKVVRGLSNGAVYQFLVKACNDYCGKWNSPASNSVVPFGPVGQPGVSATGGATSVNFSWSPPAPNGRPIDRLEINIDGGGWENVGPGSGSRTIGNGYSQPHSIRVVAFDTVGQRGPENSAGATSGPAPPPPPPVARNYIVADSFLGGTCVFNGTDGGAWPTQSQCTSSGRSWVPNGNSVGIVCATTGGTYTVKYKNGSTATWGWWGRLADGRHVRAAAIWDNNNNDGNPQC